MNDEATAFPEIDSLSGLRLAGIEHCLVEPLGGPGTLRHHGWAGVVVVAQKALGTKDLTPVLKWVKPDHEPEVRTVFTKTLIVRTKGQEAKEVADTHFFETVVRLHRATEDEPYTGLKPAGTDPGPIVKAADQALETGSVDALVQHLTEQVAAGLRERFHVAAEKKKHTDVSVEAGREFVKAYVEFMHYAEKLYQDALGQGAHHEAAAGPKLQSCEHH